MSDEQENSDFFGDEVPDEIEETVAEVETEEVEAKDDAPPAEKKGEDNWTKAAALDERRKRQAIERELSDMQREVSYLKGRASAEAEDDGDDEEDFDYGDMEGSTRRVIEKQLAARDRKNQATRDEEWRELVADCEADTKEKYNDADEVLAHYIKMEQRDQSLSRRVRRQANPTEWAYQRAKKDLEKGDETSDLKRKIEALEAKISGEADDGPPRKRRERLAGQRSSGGRASKSPLTEDEAFSGAFS